LESTVKNQAIAVKTVYASEDQPGFVMGYPEGVYVIAQQMLVGAQRIYRQRFGMLMHVMNLPPRVANITLHDYDPGFTMTPRRGRYDRAEWVLKAFAAGISAYPMEPGSTELYGVWKSMPYLGCINFGLKYHGRAVEPTAELIELVKGVPGVRSVLEAFNYTYNVAGNEVAFRLLYLMLAAYLAGCGSHEANITNVE
jgi:hypothetical protein